MSALLWQTQAQLSPGPLARAHAALDNAEGCLSCHAHGEDRSMDQQCRACHTAIDWQIENQRGLHGRESLVECAKCHPDHAGRDFELIEWPDGSPEAFDHNRTGWPLRATHSRLECRQCHKSEFQISPAAIKAKREDLGESWLGLDPSCLSCHQDFHQGSLSRTCENCHTVGGWTPAPGFDHAATDFALTGSHEKVSCDACHKTAKLFRRGEGGERLRHYAPIAHAECSSCHADPHAGRLGAECSTCHVTTGFDQISGERFDHSATQFPLLGRHRNLSCATCHDEQTGWGDRPKFERCDSCHTDAHAGTATLAGAATDCASCHDVNGFRPSTYSVADHSQAAFPLEGRHTQVACYGCHTRNSGVLRADLGSAGIELRPAHQACESCHVAAHADQTLQLQTLEQAECKDCHTVEGWKPSTFGIAEHARLALPLEHAHQDAECAECHGPVRQDLSPLPGKDILGPAGVALTVDATCESCHFNPHDVWNVAQVLHGSTSDCAICHTTIQFAHTKVDGALHTELGFPLDGAHLATPCFDCHAELTAASAEIHLLRASQPVRDLHFDIVDRDCADCHETVHGEQFVVNGLQTDCAQCHGTDTFAPASNFDHDRHSSFALVGAHESVACSGCHLTETLADGSERTRFRPVAQECRSCHGASVGALTPGRGT